MGTIRALGFSPGRNPVVIDLHDEEIVENINFFIFRDESDDRPITWYSFGGGLDLVFGETEEKRKEDFEPNRSLDDLGFDIRGHAIIVQHQVDDEDTYVNMSDADIEKYTIRFSTRSG